MRQIVNRILTDTNNFIINGDMVRWQRGEGLINNVTINGSSNLYKQADRFVYYMNRSGSDVGLTFTKQTDVPAGTSLIYSARATSNFSTAFGATNATLFPIYQRIEGTTVSQLQPGQDVWISMWVKCSVTANIPVGLVKFTTGGLEEQSYFWNESVVANTWKRIYKKITLPMDAISKSVGTSFYVTVGQCSGTAFTSYGTLPGDAWHVSGTPQLRNASSTNWADTSGNWLQVTGMMMMSDQPHTSFALCGRNPLNELALCQRYFEKSYDQSIPVGGISAAAGMATGLSNSTIASPAFTAYVKFVSLKRHSAPAVTFYNASTGGAGTWRDNGGADVAVAVYASSLSDASFIVNPTAATVNGRVFTGHWAADAEL